MTDRFMLYRKDGQETSREAAYSLVNIANMEWEVLREISRYGDYGCIADDVVRDLSHLGYNTVTPRFAALERKGLIKRPGTKRKGRSGRRQLVMVAAPFQIKLKV